MALRSGQAPAGAAIAALRTGTGRRSKYNAVRTTVDGYLFASKKEAARYVELRYLEQTGEITHLCCQPRFELWAALPLCNGWRDIALVGVYVADFQYRDQRAEGVTVVEDVKSPATRTAVYRLKKKLAEACHGIQIWEV